MHTWNRKLILFFKQDSRSHMAKATCLLKPSAAG